MTSTAAARPNAPAGGCSCTVAATAEDLAWHYKIRDAVFVQEQRVFADSDWDAVDARSDVLHVLCRSNGVPAGTVRLYPLDPIAGTWQGDRLAVLPEFRTAAGLGATLVRFAVATAGAAGGLRMIAHVQQANERFFIHLGWTPHAAEDYVGLPHVRMSIALPRS